VGSRSVLVVLAKRKITDAKLGVFMAVKVQFVIFWVVTSRSDVVGLYQGPLPVTIHFILKMELAKSSKMLTFYRIITPCHNPEDHN
jgi:hypothetical protein